MKATQAEIIAALEAAFSKRMDVLQHIGSELYRKSEPGKDRALKGQNAARKDELTSALAIAVNVIRRRID